MKKIICITLIMILALTLLVGCGKNANPTPLTPVFANGVSPDYGTVTTAPESGSNTGTSENTPVVEDSTIPEGFKLYNDSYISFVHPESFNETLRLYLNDANNGGYIAISEQALDPSSANFALKAYADVTQENYTETYASVMGNPESYDNVTVTKTNSNGFEVTVIKYFEATETPEGEEVTNDEPRFGIADIYVEKSADASFKEIFIKVSALEFPADITLEGAFNFSEIVNRLTSSLKIAG